MTGMAKKKKAKVILGGFLPPDDPIHTEPYRMLVSLSPNVTGRLLFGKQTELATSDGHFLERDTDGTQTQD
ncbi:MAG: hypothetical protein U0556_14170 [Dehalococcoidia bacterium]